MLSIPPPRGPFYVLLLILGFLQFVIALNIPSYDPENSPYLPLFTTACAIVALFTFIWVSILLGYGSSETDNKSILTRCDTHLTSFGLLSFLWLCLGIFLTINAKNECDRHTIICQQLSNCAIMGFLMFLLAFCSAAIVTYSVTVVSDLRYDSHVEYARKRALERRQGSRTWTNNDQRIGHYIPLPDLPPTAPTRPPPVYAAGRARLAPPV
ncbi:hypothetical protein JOM56_004358 [Amanita muscaria]